MCTGAEMAALENEAAAVLDSADLSTFEKQEKLSDLRRQYRNCVQRHGTLLMEYGRRARGKTLPEAEQILGDLLNSPEFQMFTLGGFAAILAVCYTGVLSGSFPGFPLIPLPGRGPVPWPRFRR